MQAVCMLLRLQLQVLRYTNLRPASVVSATDSRCAVSALAKRGSTMKPFFANKAAEVNHLVLEGRKLCPGMERVCWVEGHLNPANIGTRPGSRMSEIGDCSVWREGPDFHQLLKSK